MKTTPVNLLHMNLDIIRHIGLNIGNFKDLVQFVSCSKLIDNCFDNQFFMNYAQNLYTKEFWYRARQRPIIRSKPLKSMYCELLRIEKFQKYVEKKTHRWSIEDFYNFWRYYDARI